MTDNNNKLKKRYKLLGKKRKLKTNITHSINYNKNRQLKDED